ncbi:uncharacterized protein SPPG_04232, partial [Spizellomyces punctatus DAOM BR117]
MTAVSTTEPVLIANGQETGIKLNGWTITTRKAPIYNSSELDRASQELPIPNPEMLFGNNHLSLCHESGLQITFKAIDALKRVDASPAAAEGIKVAYADHWSQKSAAAHEKIKDVVKPYDWTYTTDYTGTIESTGSEFKPSEELIDIERLKRPDPIMFYDELILYEDELADNGTAILSLRVRVMPSCFLILLRFFLRVDDVLFRINDTRFYHQFGTNHLLREYSSREEPYSKVRAKLPKPPPWEVHKKGTEDLSPLTDANWVASVLAALGPKIPQNESQSTQPGVSTDGTDGKFVLVCESLLIPS